MPIVSTISPWKLHVRAWRACKLCSLCEVRQQVVLARGSLPCRVLFVGEAPGPSEDVLGQPFVGPAGKLLDRMIGDAGFNVADHDIQPVSYAFTNLVACIPKGDDGDKFGEPPKASIESCAPRLREIVEIAKPELIIQVGELAKKWLPKLLDQPHEDRRAGKKAVGVAVGVGRGRAAGTPQRGVAPQNVRGQHPVHRPAYVSIIHPAAILRADIAQRGLLIQRTIVTLRDALEELA